MVARTTLSFRRFVLFVGILFVCWTCHLGAEAREAQLPVAVQELDGLGPNQAAKLSQGRDKTGEFKDGTEVMPRAAMGISKQTDPNVASEEVSESVLQNPDPRSSNSLPIVRYKRSNNNESSNTQSGNSSVTVTSTPQPVNHTDATNTTDRTTSNDTSTDDIFNTTVINSNKTVGNTTNQDTDTLDRPKKGMNARLVNIIVAASVFVVLPVVVFLAVLFWSKTKHSQAGSGEESERIALLEDAAKKQDERKEKHAERKRKREEENEEKDLK